MKTIRTIQDLHIALRDARTRNLSIGVVPTMGAFHEGHLELMRRSKDTCGLTVVTLFVNPAQFNEAKDLERYPRNEAADAAMAQAAGADVLFVPSVDTIYPPGFGTTVEVAELPLPLEGIVRGAQHFRGVTTVVAKLLNMTQPDVAFFGQKDAQQALIVRRMVRDLNMPVRIEVVPTVRESDGLAMSSRNVLLDPDSRRRAPALSRALFAVASAVESGKMDTDPVLAEARQLLDGIDVEYFAAVSADSLLPVTQFDGEVLVAIAARFGAVRLIDNVLIHHHT